MNNQNPNILFNKFEIIETLKKDRQSGVYLANHILLSKKIILKTLDINNLTDESILVRFKREAKILAKLNHPNIIKVLDFSTHDNIFYISFEFFEGESLRQILKTTKLDYDSIIKIAKQILFGLDYAHSNKIIHRDLKPENIFINNNHEVKIGDFGLALSEEDVQVTNKEAIVGTPSYLSPEQIRGDKLDNRTDIFSFGIILYEMLAGINPFVSKDIASTINNILNIDNESLRDKIKAAPEKLILITIKSLEKKRENRFNSVKEILDTLGETYRETLSSTITRKRSPSLSIKYFLLVISIIMLIGIVTQLNIFPTKNENESATKKSINFEHQKSSQPVITSPSFDKKPGKDPIEHTFNQKDKYQEMNNKLDSEAQSYGQVMITCYPWADIYLNNTKIETTPLKEPLTLQTGNYELKLHHPNFPDFKIPIKISANSLERINFNFYEYFSFLNFQIIPWGEITIDEELAGVTPLKEPLPVKPGKHIINIKNPAFGTYIDTIYTVSGETLNYRLNLNSVVTWHNN